MAVCACVGVLLLEYKLNNEKILQLYNINKKRYKRKSDLLSWVTYSDPEIGPWPT